MITHGFTTIFTCVSAQLSPGLWTSWKQRYIWFMPSKYLVKLLTHTASTRSMSRSDLLPGVESVLARHESKEASQEIFLVSQQDFIYCGCLVFSAEIDLETGVYRTNCFQMNSDLQLIDKVQQKSQKSSLCTVYLGTSFNHTFIRNTACHADPPDNLPPCESPLLPSLMYS